MSTNADLPIGPTQAAILAALEAGCTRRAAAGAGGIHHATFYRWLEDATFRDAVEKAENVAEAKATVIVTKAAYEGQWTAAAWWLERRRHEQYARREKVDMTVDLRERAAAIAGKFGLDPDAVLAEAEAILAGK